MSLPEPETVPQILTLTLETILKNIPWRKHPNLLSASKSSLQNLRTLPTPLPYLSLPSAAPLLEPLQLSLRSSNPKLILPSLSALFRLFSLNFIHLDPNSTVSDLITSVCDCVSVGDETVELTVLKTVLAAVRSDHVCFDGELLNYVVRTCYNVYLGGFGGVNTISAKAVLAQIVVIVFSRVEFDSLIVPRFRIVSVLDLVQFTDRNLIDGSNNNYVSVVQSLINEVMEGNYSDGVIERVSDNVDDLKESGPVKTAEDGDDEVAVDDVKESKLREDGFTLFKNLCKLSMKFSSQDHSDDEILLRGKILSLELLKVIMDNSGLVWKSNDRQVSPFF